MVSQGRRQHNAMGRKEPNDGGENSEWYMMQTKGQYPLFSKFESLKTTLVMQIGLAIN